VSTTLSKLATSGEVQKAERGYRLQSSRPDLLVVRRGKLDVKSARFILAAAVAGIVLGVAATATASSTVHSCTNPHGLFTFGGGHQEYIVDLSARN
jgi:hypothetical protein